MIKRLSKIFLIFAFLHCLPGVAAPGAILPNLEMKDISGTSVTMDSLKQDSHWVLVVLEANVTSSQKFMDLLKKTAFDGEKTVMLVSGDPLVTEAFIKSKSPLIPSARWLYGNNVYIINGLKLSGTPSILGVDERNQITWQAFGLPNPKDNLIMKIKAWNQTPLPIR